MFEIRSKSGQSLEYCSVNEAGKPVLFQTYVAAEREIRAIKESFPKDYFKIVAVGCERCGGPNDVTIIHVNDEPKAYCQNCRVELFIKKKPVGRPAVGVTRKVSLTLPENEWEWLDENAKGNRSQFLRHLVWEAQSSENEWNNYACLGYAIAGAKQLGYDDEKVRELVRAIYGEFDLKSVQEAEKVYLESDY